MDPQHLLFSLGNKMNSVYDAIKRENLSFTILITGETRFFIGFFICLKGIYAYVHIEITNK